MPRGHNRGYHFLACLHPTLCGAVLAAKGNLVELARLQIAAAIDRLTLAMTHA